jgi:hypothetical protein
MVGVGANGARRTLIAIRTVRDLHDQSSRAGGNPKFGDGDSVSAFAGQGPSSQQNRPRRPLASALTHSIVEGLWAPGTYGCLRGLPGGAEGIQTDGHRGLTSSGREIRPENRSDSHLGHQPDLPLGRDRLCFGSNLRRRAVARTRSCSFKFPSNDPLTATVRILLAPPGSRREPPWVPGAHNPSTV